MEPRQEHDASHAADLNVNLTMERCTPPPTTLQHPPRYPGGGGYTLLRRLRYALETFAYNEEYDETEREEHERSYDLLCVRFGCAP